MATFEVVSELVGIAATWNEVDPLDEEPLIAPGDWVEFALHHEWSDPNRVNDLMIGLWSLARSASADAHCHPSSARRWSAGEGGTVVAITSRSHGRERSA